MFWIKIGFIVVSFVQGITGGLIPTWSEGCRSNPTIVGIANSFAGGIFLAIALLHVLPEEIEAWTAYCGDADRIFPLPEALAFAGYTIILILDKILFDTHAILDQMDGHSPQDPASKRLEADLEASS